MIIRNDQQGDQRDGVVFNNLFMVFGFRCFPPLVVLIKICGFSQ